LRLHSRCQSRAALVTLGDVAEIYAVSEQQRQALAAVELFPAPVAPQQRFVRIGEIQDLLLRRGVKLAEHRFSGSNQVAVAGFSGQAPSQPQRPLALAEVQTANRRVRDAITRYLATYGTASRSLNVDFQLTDAQVHLIARSSGAISLRGGGPPWTGVQRFQATLNTPNGPIEFPLQASIALPPAVVVAVRAIRSGAVVRAADVALQPADANVAADQLIYSLNEVLGMETSRSIPLGKVVERRALRRPVLIRRGDPVDVYARSAGIVVKTTARARDNGSLGDAVLMEGPNKSTYLARVIGVREAEVYARAPQVTPPARPASYAPQRLPANPTSKGVQRAYSLD